ncbi:RTA1 like protein-domain-containing protein [Sphaerosporella brunnea]|uniref:RTA1 like protein-domain-containing protein n=1 Tax=Sphaerosporella brunnea TaxID=1250544 RepID=A0A5J5F3H8_9PEZI|nr:RTA1 like protein-domain-containing protein [Sphaerosporella brunnea]
MSDEPGKFVFYRYTPSLAAATIFMLAFFATSILHAVQLFRTKTWYFIPLLIGALMEAIGYIGRMQSAHDTNSLGPYMQQSLLLLIAPSLFAASIYMVLGRLIRVVGAERYSLFSPRWLTKIFVAGDVFSFFMQSSGGGIMASSKTSSAMKTGQNVVIGGLIVQILFFSVFMLVAVIFHVRIRSTPTVLASTLQQHGRRGWITLLYVLYVASALILVRSLFRVVEYAEGNDGDLLKHEVFLYVFDSTLMLGALVLFNAVHPSQVVPGGNTEIRAMEPRFDGMHMASVRDLTRDGRP